MNDPTHLIVNVRFTGDVAAHEAELRALYGGPLCVSEGEHTEAELVRIQEELGDRDGPAVEQLRHHREQVELGVVSTTGPAGRDRRALRRGRGRRAARARAR